MSHFTVAVIHREDQNIEELLAPYDENLEVEPYIRFTRQEAIDYARENYTPAAGKTDEECWQMVAEDGQTDADGNILSTYNPRSTWDWWVIGGRWRDMLRLKDGSTANSARIGDIDFTMDDEAYRRCLRFWDVVVEHQPAKEGEDFFSFFNEAYYREFYGDRETYARHQAAFSTYAVITPAGVWYAKGKMGWWAMSSETPEEARDWEEHFKERFIDAFDEDMILTIVDCHI